MEVPKIVQELLDKKAEMSNIIDLDAYANGLLDMYQALQLLQTDVMRSACKHDEKNDTKAYAKNGNEFIGYYCEKCDTVYCGSI